MIQFVNITNTIQCSQTSKQNELLSLINATFSHELRNPLNSICAQAISIKVLLEQMSQLIVKFNQNDENKANMNRILVKLQQG